MNGSKVDVDLLRPGTVPISPDTILWFEFLLDQTLLINHLQKPSPDPSATDLITKFTTAIYESMKNEVKRTDAEPMETNNLENECQPKLSLKVLALKVLSLKVAAVIKWNLVSIRNTPFKIQINLLQDLLYFTGGKMPIEIPEVPIVNANPTEVENIPKEYLFALVVYHRWLIGTSMHKIFANMSNNRTNGDITPLDEKIICTNENIENSLSFLTQSLEWQDPPPLLTHSCFVFMTESSTETQFQWDDATPIAREAFRAQIHYDIGVFCFFKENYQLAANHFQACSKYLQDLQDLGDFCIVDKDALENYVFACLGDAEKKSLFEEMNECVAKNYDGILNVLIQDNKHREIPISERIILELNLAAGLSSGKYNVNNDLLIKIQALNAVRCVVGRFTSHCFKYTLQNVDFLIWATSAMWKSVNEIDKNLLSSYFVQIIVNLECEDLLQKLLRHEILTNIFDGVDLDSLRCSVRKSVDVPALLKDSYWDLQAPNKNPKLEIRLLELQIISCYSSMELRELLVKLTIKNPNRPIWKINPNWELPIPLQSVVNTIPRGFLQDFSYVLLAKSRELMLSKDFGSSIDFLKILEKEVLENGSQAKLAKLISWEILLVQISQYFDEWPALHLDRQELVQSCESCLKNTEMIPRTEVMEQCVLCMLNFGHWEFLISIKKPWTYIEIASAIALACQDIVKFCKTNKKVNMDIWELIVPIFATTSQSKRSSSGASVMHRDSPTSNNKIQLLAFLIRLRDATALSVVISVLARLYNLLNDDPSITVNVDYVGLWPSMISSISSYNIVAVTEALSDLVLQALRYYPTNIPWLHLMGDLCFANSNYDNSLRYYLQSLIVQTDNFNLPVRAEDRIFRRMIKCCTHLGCHTQAAVLCQFLEQPDYTRAFRSLVDFKSCNDSVEAYYHCFWDTNILEYLVHLHHKRGEYQRKKKAVHTIGMLELNSNNNSEIHREAVNLRKRTFLQALCRQYVR